MKYYVTLVDSGFVFEYDTYSASLKDYTYFNMLYKRDGWDCPKITQGIDWFALQIILTE